jgi:hypothetical protein
MNKIQTEVLEACGDDVEASIMTKNGVLCFITKSGWHNVVEPNGKGTSNYSKGQWDSEGYLNIDK